MVGSKICAVLFGSLSQKISERESFKKSKSTKSVFPRVSDAGDALVSSTTFLSKMTLHRI